MTSDSTYDAVVPVSYLPGYVFLSYVISAMGCITTLELLYRRTAMAGLYNWYLLMTSSLTMGGIGIWCMYFIGNRAIVLGNGAPHMQVSYSATYTGISFVIAVVVLLIAFAAAGIGERASYGRIVMGGWLTGSAICGMHYVGQLGIANYKCSYDVEYVTGSAIIAIYASCVSLGIFFRWRSTWADSWWRRAVSGCFLAGSVSGMNWTAAVGTSYKDHDMSVVHGDQLSRSQTVIICTVLSCVACVILFVCAVIAGGNRRRSSALAHQIVLSSAFFDPEGRIMVTPEAFLPTRKIVDHYIGRTFSDDDLTRTHPAFIWAFRASRNWKMVKDLVPFMRSRLESERNAIQQHLLSRGVFMDKDTELQTDFDTLFKQLFCVAAQDLADELRQPLQDLGTLYDEILATTLSKSSLPKMIRRRQRHAKGQVIFTVRQLSRQEASRMAASGFRFSSVEHVTTVLSRRIHVSLADLNHHLKDMRDYATTGRNFDPGVHLISFVMRPTVHDHFEVLTARGTGNPLPSSTLPISRLQMHHLTLVSRMDGWPIRKCINYLETEAAQDGAPVDDFRRQLSEAMSSLSTTLPPDTIATAALCPRLLLAPCRPSTSPSPSTPPDEPRCFLLAFCALGTLDTQPATPPTQTFTPLRLFRAQQQVNDGATSHRDVFSKELNQDLFYSSNVKSVSRDPDPYPNSRSHSHNSPSSPTRPTIRLWPRRHSSTGALSSVSQESLVDKDPASASVNPFAEIMVHKEVKVDVAKISDVSVPSTPVKRSSSSRTTATHSNTAFGGGAGAGAGGGGGGGDLVPSTYVDELYSFCHSHGVRVRSDRNLPPGSSGALWGEGEGGGRSWA